MKGPEIGNGSRKIPIKSIKHVTDLSGINIDITINLASRNSIAIRHLGRFSPLNQKLKSLGFLKYVDIAVNQLHALILYIPIGSTNKYKAKH